MSNEINPYKEPDCTKLIDDNELSIDELITLLKSTLPVRNNLFFMAGVIFGLVLCLVVILIGVLFVLIFN